MQKEIDQQYLKDLARKMPLAARTAIKMLDADWSTARYDLPDTGCYFLWWHYKDNPLCEQRKTGKQRHRGWFIYEYRLTLLGTLVRDTILYE